MTLGGLHKSSKIAVAKGIGWEKSRELWYNSFTKLGPTSNHAMAAYTQLAHAATQGPDVLGAVACAWYAVGVLDLIDLQVRAVVCGGASSPTTAPAPATPGCNGFSSNYVCSDGTPGFATACNAAAQTVYCADPAQRCKKASPTDPTASVSASGALECE